MLPESWEVLITALILSVVLAPGLMIVFRLPPVEAYQIALVGSAAIAAMVYDLTTPRSRRVTWRGE